MLGWIKNTARKSEAAVLVQQALDHHILMGMKPFDTDKVSNALVALVWDRKPDLFEGKMGKRPHKMSVAAIALATGLHEFEDGGVAQKTILLALGAVLMEIANNGRFYDLGGADQWMIDRADQAYGEISEKLQPSQDAVIGSFM